MFILGQIQSFYDQQIKFLLILFFLGSFTIVDIAAQSLVGKGEVVAPVVKEKDVWHDELKGLKYKIPFQVRAKQAVNEPILFQWPMDGLPQSNHVMHNYVDHADEGSIMDYTGGSHTYDGHSGTDLSLRNFREMDQGVPVYAANDGVVSLSQYGYDDRNTEWAPDLGPLWNGVAIFHNDSIATRYLHFRKNSVVVEEDELVKAGDLLGYVGSSGFSSNPHLHFDVLIVDDEDNARIRDPWEGSTHSEESLWENQLPYLGDEHFSVYDTGIATRASMGGQIQFIWNDFVEGLSEPEIFGINEPEIIFWINAQVLTGDLYRVEIYRPDDTLYSGGNGTFLEKTSFGYWYFYWNFDGYVMESDFGEWTVRVLGADSEGDLNTVLGESKITVGEETVWGPRFLPAGKSIRINGTPQQDTLQMSEFTGEVNFELVNAPDFVNLNGNVVEFASESTQPLRSAYFDVIATDQNGLTDTFTYHVVDPAKPRNITTIHQWEMIGSQGGEIQDDSSGAIVTIPEGALTGETEIEMGLFTIIPDGAETYGDMIYLGPSGLGFSQPVTVTVPYDSNLFPEEFSAQDLVLLRYDKSADAWIALESEVNIENQTVTGTTTTFSGFAAGTMTSTSTETTNTDRPDQFTLHQNFPNPFNPSTVIRYSLPAASQVRIEVFNLLGQQVAVLVNERKTAGQHRINFNAGNLSSGLYLYRIVTPEFTQSHKMMLLK